jgi:hypothetical protein
VPSRHTRNVKRHSKGELGVQSVRLLSNNPRKLVAIEGYGLSVAEWLAP